MMLLLLVLFSKCGVYMGSGSSVIARLVVVSKGQRLTGCKAASASAHHNRHGSTEEVVHVLVSADFVGGRWTA